jgi:hypothetical protein
MLVAAASAVAQEKAKPAAEPKKPALTAEQIIDKSIQAAGGRAAMEKLVSTYAKGMLEFKAQDMYGMLEIYAKAPNKQLILMNLDMVGEVKQAFDGQLAWAQEPSGHVVEISGAPLEEARRRAVFNAPLKWHELYSKAEFTGEGSVGGHKAYMIRLSGDGGQSVTRYYDQETFLLLREAGNHETPQGPMDVQADFSDYRDVDGVKSPFQIRQTLPQGEMVLKISEIKNNVEIDDAKFAKPADK